MVNDKLIQPVAVDSQEFKNKAIQILKSNSTEYIPHGLRVHAYIFLTDDSHYEELITNYFNDILTGPLGGPYKHPTAKDFVIDHPYEKEVSYYYFKILRAMQNKW